MGWRYRRREKYFRCKEQTAGNRDFGQADGIWLYLIRNRQGNEETDLSGFGFGVALRRGRLRYGVRRERVWIFVRAENAYRAFDGEKLRF